MLVALVLAARRRPPEAVITIGSARGRPGLAIHPWRGHSSTTAVAWLLLALILIFGLYEIGRSNYYAAGFLLGGGLAMACVGWCRATAMLAIGGGSLYLLVTTGSAPAIGTASEAVAVVLGSAVVIWMTRKSLDKKQYRGY